VAEMFNPLINKLAVDQTESSSFVHKEGYFSIGYGTPGSAVVGEYFTDDLAFGDFELSQVTMALATDVREIFAGIMGLGFPAGQADVVYGKSTTPYKTILEQMVSQNLTKSRTFSIWLDSQNADSGNILFGGYDTAKFKGNLSFLEIQPPRNSFAVALTDVWFQADDDKKDIRSSFTLLKPLLVLLDTGSTLTRLPPIIFRTAGKLFWCHQYEYWIRRGLPNRSSGG
jgi:hypothetical protein